MQHKLFLIGTNWNSNLPTEPGTRRVAVEGMIMHYARPRPMFAPTRLG